MFELKTSHILQLVNTKPARFIPIAKYAGIWNDRLPAHRYPYLGRDGYYYFTIPGWKRE